MYSKGNRLHELAEEEPPKLPKGLGEKASISPIHSPVKSSPQPTWTEIDRKAQKSLLPHSSPRISPPSALWKQSQVDRPHHVSPAHSTESSRAGSVVSTKANSASVEPPKLPSQPDFIMQEGDMHVQDIEDDMTLFDDKKGFSGMKPGQTEPPILDGQPASDAKDTEYSRQQPAYVEIPILDGPPSPVNPLQNVSNLTPKTKRKWLRSPFSRQKGSTGDVEDTSSDRERDDDKKKKKFKIGTQKDHKAIKNKPQRAGSDPSLAQNQNSRSPNKPPSAPRVKSSSSNRNSDISNDIRSIIDNMGGDSEFCEMYSRKLPSLPSRAEPKSDGSSPGGIRLPVPFQLKSGSSPPNLVRVGFDLPPKLSSLPGRAHHTTLVCIMCPCD